MFPMSNGDLMEAFEKYASNKDDTFSQIAATAKDNMAKQNVEAYKAIFEATGTNELAKYFPQYKVAEEENPNVAVLNSLQRQVAGRVRLGLDIKGGTSFLVGMATTRTVEDENGNVREEEMDTDQRSYALNKAVEILRKRVDSMGVAEPQITPSGTDRITIALPGLTEGENEAARRQIERAAFLEFRMVHPQSAELLAQDYVEPGYEVLTEKLKSKRKSGDTEETEARRYLVKKKPEEGLTGKYITGATPHRNPLDNSVAISFTLDSEGAQKFAKVTRENVGELLGIVLDGELASAPRINGEIPSGSGEITGDFTIEEGIELANVLMNPLESPVKILEERRVDPSLGADSIRSGIVACIIGAVLVSLFMLFYYMFAGMVANIAMVLNLIVLLGVMCLIGSTLTIPGMAGIVLTIGMAVDANVLIYERIREELAKGKSLRSAVAAGYDRAFGVIFDGNLTTLFAGIIMIWLGSGPVRGFGVTLSIGIASSMYTALVVTRLVFDFFLNRGKSTLKMHHIIGETNFDFLGFAKKATILSCIVIIGGWGYMLGIRGSDAMGVDFKGGDALTLSFEKKTPVEELRKAVKVVEGESRVSYQASLSGGAETLSVVVEEGQGENAEKALVQAFPEAGFSRLSLDHIGAAVGSQITVGAVKALLWAFLAILIYVAMRYEFSFAVGSVVALVHDIMISIALFVVTGRQFNAPVIAALLTIIGFSINDTIVIFDRVREDIKLGVKGTLREIFNRALNQTLSRTIITSITVLLAVLALYIFGGNVINDFAFIFMVGVIVGTWSSLFISSSVVLWLTGGRKPKLAGADAAVQVVDPTVYKEQN